MEYSYTLSLDPINQWVIASITENGTGRVMNDCVFKDTVGLTSEQIRVEVEKSIREELAREVAAEAERVELASRRAALEALVSARPTTLNIS